MFAAVTNVVSVWRGGDDTDDRDDPVSDDTMVLDNVYVSINESGVLSDQPAGSSERTTHVYSGRAKWGTDIRKGDRLYDERNDRNYTVTSVTKKRSAMHKADLAFELRSSQSNS